MQDRGFEPDIVVINSLLNGCAKCGIWERALLLLDVIQSRDIAGVMGSAVLLCSFLL